MTRYVPINDVENINGTMKEMKEKIQKNTSEERENSKPHYIAEISSNGQTNGMPPS